MERHHSFVPARGCEGEQTDSLAAPPSAAAVVGERDEATKQADELRSLLHLPGCSTVPALSLLRACLCGLRVKTVGILGTVAILLTKVRGSSMVFLLLKVRYDLKPSFRTWLGFFLPVSPRQGKLESVCNKSWP